MSQRPQNNRPTSPLEAVNMNCVLFLDIETVPIAADFEQLPEVFKDLWRAKSHKYDYEKLTPEELFFQKGGIHAEFGKIICISLGYFKPSSADGRPEFRVKSIAADEERVILESFRELMDNHYFDCDKHYLCAHNGIEFDFPYIARRMMINGVKLPRLLNVAGTKSWNNPWLIDTMDLWRFGDYKERTSLSLLAACFGIESPKDDISGKDVAKVYYQDHDLERISLYCTKDVVTLAKLFLRFQGALEVEDVVYL